MKILSLTAWFIVLLTLPCFSQWYFLNPVATSENYTAIDFIDQSHGFALSVHGTLVETNDGGFHWSMLQQIISGKSTVRHIFTDLAFFPAGAGIVIGSGGLIMRSADYGKTWDSIYTGVSEDLLSLFMFSDMIGYVTGFQGTILKTNNGGTSWTSIATTLTRNFFDCFFITGKTGFIAADKSLFKTTDGGTSWIEVLHPDSGRNVTRVAFSDTLHGMAIGRNGTIFKTENGGEDWIRIPSGTTASLQDLTFISSENVLICAGGGKILKSTNGGDSWDVIQTSFPYDLNGFSFSSETRGCVFGPLGTILTTTDQGLTWQPSSFVTLSNLWDLSFPNESNGFVSGNGMIMKTEDGGNTWRILPVPTQQPLNAICMVSEKRGFCAGGNGVILKSISGGELWTPLVSPAINSWQDLFFLDSNHGFLVGITPIIYQTENGGNSWSEYNTNTDAAINSIDFAGNTGFACGSSATLLQSGDGGVSWSRIMIPELMKANLSKVDCVSDSVCYVAGNQYLSDGYTIFFAGTLDGGKSWRVSTFVYYPSKTVTSLTFLDSRTGFMGGSDFIWKTTDGGIHWVEQDFVTNQTGVNSMFFVNDQTGFAVSYEGRILKTTNGGGTGIPEKACSPPFILHQNFPNPFIDKTEISFELIHKGKVELAVMNQEGIVIKILLNKECSSGNHRVAFQSSGLPSGLYFYRIRTEGYQEVKKMIIR